MFMTNTDVQPPSFATATEISIRRENVIAISTGSKAVDQMLGGKLTCERRLTSPRRNHDAVNHGGLWRIQNGKGELNALLSLQV